MANSSSGNQANSKNKIHYVMASDIKGVQVSLLDFGKAVDPTRLPRFGDVLTGKIELEHAVLPVSKDAELTADEKSEIKKKAFLAADDNITIATFTTDNYNRYLVLLDSKDIDVSFQNNRLTFTYTPSKTRPRILIDVPGGENYMAKIVSSGNRTTFIYAGGKPHLTKDGKKLYRVHVGMYYQEGTDKSWKIKEKATDYWVELDENHNILKVYEYKTPLGIKLLGGKFKEVGEDITNVDWTTKELGKIDWLKKDKVTLTIGKGK